jgi:transcriptional regulator with XRE-family HTH domain
MTLGIRLLTTRKTLKVTQQELAEKLNVSPQHISLIEQEKVAPSLGLLAGLAKELGVTTDFLISGKEGIITEAIPAIKADKKLNLKTKKALIAIIEEFYTGESSSHTESSQ